MKTAFLCLALLLMPCPAWAERGLVGGQFEYVVQPGDYLIKVAARHGIAAAVLARESGLEYGDHLKPGTRLAVDNRHIVPDGPDDGILINIPQRMLFLLESGRVVTAYPVGLGRPDWPTPVGRFAIRDMAIDKPWIVPPSIQEEMRAKGLPVLTEVAPGPDNPLGRHWMALTPGLWGIHGTNAPASVFHFQSHGCIRLHPDDAAALFDRIHIGLPVRIIYQPLLLTRTAAGELYLEVHRDSYGRGVDNIRMLMDTAMQQGWLDAIDWTRADEALDRVEGVARRIDREEPH